MNLNGSKSLDETSAFRKLSQPLAGSMELHMRYPRYSGPNRSGLCVCGHKWDDHHLGMVMKPDYVKETGEIYIAQECEFYGFNEDSGKDANGNDHCWGYKDTLDENKE